MASKADRVLAEALALIASIKKDQEAYIQTGMKRNHGHFDHESDDPDEISKKARMNLSPTHFPSPGIESAASQQNDDLPNHCTSGGSGPGSPLAIDNWRQIVCDTLNISSHISDDILKGLLEDRMVPLTPVDKALTPPPPEPSYVILHRTHCRNLGRLQSTARLWVDEPFLVEIDDSSMEAHLSGKDGVSHLLKYLDRHGPSFLIIREYNCCGDLATFDIKDRSLPYGETIVLNSAQVCKALNLAQDCVSDGHNAVSAFELRVERSGLEHWLYRFADEVLRLSGSTSVYDQKEVACFMSYVKTHKLEELRTIRETLAKGKVTKRLLPYLFVPYQVCVLKNKQGNELSRGVRLSSWPEFSSTFIDNDALKPGKSKKVKTKMVLTQFHWEFNGHFQHCITSNVTYEFHWNGDEGLDISNFRLVPYDHVGTTAQSMLQERGEMIWRCRYMKFVSYSGYEALGVEWFTDARFIIDCNSFRCSQLGPKATSQSTNAGVTDNLASAEMIKKEPPAGDFVLLLPATLMGFNMQEKQWKSLVMCRVREVDWDNQAFHCLVLPQDTKDVIKALVTHRAAQSKSSDLIQSKGSGLTLLFHGPPGTGKTLTAESVAEHARKPLYRVTCGDIGTQPEAVEQYLKRVLGRARAWGCVVLLDEAEVFLQERSLTDLHRNALVSVFLRVLEYYDGILILTSNRVGTLDEGFRSRIQLALEYSKLDRGSRRKIWENFIDRLNDDPTVSGELDIADLRDNLAQLSSYELNGREIRNAINVARPLALSCRQKVDFKCLKKVIGVQRRFDRYIMEMNEGLDDEKVAREEGKR